MRSLWCAAQVSRSVLFLSLVCLALPTLAQENEDDRLELDTPLTVDLVEGEPRFLTFAAVAGEVVTITLRSLDTGDDPLNNPILAVRDPDGRRLAYNNDHQSDRDDLLPADAQIEHLTLPEAGVYVIRVDTYGSVYTGAFEVLVERSDPFNAVIEGVETEVIITATLPEHTPYTYEIEAEAGDSLTVVMRDLSRQLDPVLRVLDADGEQVAFNDDHAGDALWLDTFDSRLEYTVTADGLYTIVAGDFLGESGEFEMVLLLEQG